MKINKILDLIYPKGLTCNACGKELNDNEREFSVCSGCADAMAKVKENPVRYGKLDVYSRFEYGGAVRKFILGYKDANKPYLCEYIAKYLYALYVEFDLSANAVCYVPSSPSAQKRRGYDGMKLIAEEFSKLAGIPVIYSLFSKDGIDQTLLSERERRRNAKDKFLSRERVSGNVLLLDDVVTSGATVEECGDVLLRHGANSVTVLTLARA